MTNKSTLPLATVKETALFLWTIATGLTYFLLFLKNTSSTLEDISVFFVAIIVIFGPFFIYLLRRNFNPSYFLRDLTAITWMFIISPYFFVTAFIFYPIPSFTATYEPTTPSIPDFINYWIYLTLILMILYFPPLAQLTRNHYRFQSFAKRVFFSGWAGIGIMNIFWIFYHFYSTNELALISGTTWQMSWIIFHFLFFITPTGFYFLNRKGRV